MKQFLYLVQSRIKCLEDQKILESDNSDYIVATFEKKIDQENFIYVPNSTWTEGRNALYEEALKRKDQYEYFVFLDDDVTFKRGSFRVFETEVSHIQADCAVPVFTFVPSIERYDAFIPFQYSIITYIDQIVICLSRELFCSPKLLPYDMDYAGKLHLGGQDIAPSHTFFMKLFEHFSDKKLLVTNNVAVDNIYSETRYELKDLTPFLALHFYPALKKHYALNNPGYRDIIRKEMPGIIYREHEDKLRHLRHKIRLIVPGRLDINTLLHKIFQIYLALLAKYIFIITFIRSLKLNLRLRRAQQ